MADQPLPPHVQQSQQVLKLGTLNVHVHSPEQSYFDGEAKALSSVNERGPFDVLPGHENFISIIKDKVVIFPTQGEKKEVKIEHGVLKVDNNNIHVFLGIDTV